MHTALPDTPRSWNCRGQLLSLDAPVILGILNITPDSFSDGGRHDSPQAALDHAGTLLAQGAHILDVGAASTRPGSQPPSVQQELDRLLPVAELLTKHLPQGTLYSIDTYRYEVGAAALTAGFHIVNDVTGGLHSPQLMALAAVSHAPYILMHSRADPATMQQPQHTEYPSGVATEVYQHLVQRIAAARAAGVVDMAIDPGFGFAKTLEQNYQLLQALPLLCRAGVPVLAGLSRKGMLWRLLEVAPQDTEAAATALHVQALLGGATFLRVHRPDYARQAVSLYQMLRHIARPAHTPA